MNIKISQIFFLASTNRLPITRMHWGIFAYSTRPWFGKLCYSIFNGLGGKLSKVKAEVGFGSANARKKPFFFEVKPLNVLFLHFFFGGAPCAKLTIRENLAITWPDTDRLFAAQAYQRKISVSLWWGFFDAKTNGNPRFLKHKQLRSSGAPLLDLAKSIYYSIIFVFVVRLCRMSAGWLLSLLTPQLTTSQAWSEIYWSKFYRNSTMKRKSGYADLKSFFCTRKLKDSGFETALVQSQARDRKVPAGLKTTRGLDYWSSLALPAVFSFLDHVGLPASNFTSITDSQCRQFDCCFFFLFAFRAERINKGSWDGSIQTHSGRWVRH